MEKSFRNTLGNRLVMPLQHFMHQEKSGGIVLGISIIVALVLANSPLAEAYHHFFSHKLGFVFNGEDYLNFSLHHWINDGLMSMFFFVVGLELKREFIGGELANIRNTIHPIVAAVFGMLVPALLYFAFNPAGDASAGWGIPMATDIAFSLAVIYLLGDRVPLTVKVFLTTLAIVDDLGAVLVIALFYTSEISLANIGIGMMFLMIMFAANKLGVKNVIFYGVLGIGGVWTAFLLSGIHATIAAVLAAFMIPADAKLSESDYLSRVSKLVKRFKEARPNEVSTLEKEQVEIVDGIMADSRDAIPPLQRLEHSMHPLVSFVIMPIFALANAGISFEGMDASAVFADNVTWGVITGLLIGKPAGIMLATLLLTQFKLARPAEALTFNRVLGVGFLASIGFTMSMFISTLAFTDAGCLIHAKIGIFVASIIGGVLGYILLRRA